MSVRARVTEAPYQVLSNLRFWDFTMHPYTAVDVLGPALQDKAPKAREAKECLRQLRAEHQAIRAGAAVVCSQIEASRKTPDGTTIPRSVHFPVGWKGGQGLTRLVVARREDWCDISHGQANRLCAERKVVDNDTFSERVRELLLGGDDPAKVEPVWTVQASGGTDLTLLGCQVQYGISENNTSYGVCFDAAAIEAGTPADLAACNMGHMVIGEPQLAAIRVPSFPAIWRPGLAAVQCVIAADTITARPHPS